MGKEKVSNNKTRKAHVSKSVQDTIPYIGVYDALSAGGIIEIEEGRFTKSYHIPNVNYSDAGEEKQEEILFAFENILGSFNPANSYEITVFNRTVDQATVNKRVLIKYEHDEYDMLRSEHNDIVMNKMSEGRNDIESERVLTVGISAADIREAMDKFTSLERELEVKFKKVFSGDGLAPLSLKDRLGLLHDMYNVNKAGEFERIYDPEALRSQGLTSKDIIGPSDIDFKKNDMIRMGDVYTKVLYLKHIPTILSSTLIENLTGINANIIVSVHYEAQPKDKSISFASQQVTNIGGEVVKAQKNLSKAGASPELISPRLETAQNDAKDLLAALTNGDQTLLHVTVVVAVFAENVEDLKLYTDQVKTRAKECACLLEVLNSQQEQGFNTALPLAENFLKTKRIMTNHSASAIQPFSSQELQYAGGIYYGLNQLSKNVIVYNREAGNNQNGVILGSPGSGKSFAAKFEMYQARLATTAQIFVIDPEREYSVLAERFNGTIFQIKPGGDIHINPLDLDITKSDDGDPFSVKVDFVLALVETMMGGNMQLTGYARGIIDRALKVVYADYLDYLHATNQTIDREKCPTLVDFYNVLLSQREEEARRLAKEIEIYCTGSMNLFAFKTNIDVNSSFIIYDIKDIGAGSSLNDIGMQICLNDIWNRMIFNRKQNRRTWFYIDEMHLLLNHSASAAYLEMVWKRARKWMGSPTGITQNVSDLLRSAEGQSILKTSDFALILNQNKLDRQVLADIYEISEDQQTYITNAGSGEGLVRTNKTIIPFENHIPNDNEIYKLLSTKPKDAEIIGA